MLTYADVTDLVVAAFEKADLPRMLTYADVCRRMLTYADVTDLVVAAFEEADLPRDMFVDRLSAALAAIGEALSY
jgi:hypothetical protein